MLPQATQYRVENPDLGTPLSSSPEFHAEKPSSSLAMKRNRVQFEANGEVSSASPQGGFTPEDHSRQTQHVPKISRRIRACTECKRHKVRCDMKAGESICSRCRRMDLECIVNKSLQTLLEDEAE